MIAFARAAVSLAVLLTMIVSTGCGRKAMPEPRKSDRPSTVTPIGER